MPVAILFGYWFAMLGMIEIPLRIYSFATEAQKRQRKKQKTLRRFSFSVFLWQFYFLYPVCQIKIGSIKKQKNLLYTLKYKGVCINRISGKNRVVSSPRTVRWFLYCTIYFINVMFYTKQYPTFGVRKRMFH